MLSWELPRDAALAEEEPDAEADADVEETAEEALPDEEQPASIALLATVAPMIPVSLNRSRLAYRRSCMLLIRFLSFVCRMTKLLICTILKQECSSKDRIFVAKEIFNQEYY